MLREEYKEELFSKMLTPTVRVEIKQRVRRGRKFRKGKTLSDENDDTTAGVWRKNTGSGVSAIESQGRVFKESERGRQVEIRLLDTDEFYRMK